MDKLNKVEFDKYFRSLRLELKEVVSASMMMTLFYLIKYEPLKSTYLTDVDAISKKVEEMLQYCEGSNDLKAFYIENSYLKYEVAEIIDEIADELSKVECGLKVLRNNYPFEELVYFELSEEACQSFLDNQ